MTRAAAEIAYIRLNRAKLALDQAVTGYQQLVDSASAVIEHRRSEKKSITDLISAAAARHHARPALLGDGDLGDLLNQALDFVEADPLTDDQEDWLENGLALVDARRDLEYPPYPGPIIRNPRHGRRRRRLDSPRAGYDPATGYLSDDDNGDGQAQLGRYCYTGGAGLQCRHPCRPPR